MRYVIYIALMMAWTKTFAQADTSLKSHTHPLSIVTVTSSKETSATGQWSQDVPLNETTQAGMATLAQVLAYQSDLYIKLNGTATLATASIRGNTAEQTPVMWNGVNLQSPANGTMDLSLLPAFMFSSARVTYGDEGTLQGSGHSGGAIELDNTTQFADTLLFSSLLSFGSFNQMQAGLKLQTGTTDFFNRTTFYYAGAQNNYPFYNRATLNDTLQKLPNAAYDMLHIMQENSFRIKHNQIVDVKYWYAATHRDIPPTMVSTPDGSYQNDESHRALIAWQYCGTKSVVYVRDYFIYEYLNYYDGTEKIAYPSKSILSSTEVEAHFYPTTHWHITTGAQYNSENSLTDGYVSWRSRNHAALYAAAKYDYKKWTVSASVRDEYVLAKVIPPVFNAALTHALGTHLTINAEWNKHYRLPTLNELYWIPGGNINLKPETGNLYQLTGSYKQRINRWLFMAHVSIYSDIVNDEIVWLPTPSGNWEPFNYNRVWSRGATAAADGTYSIGRWQLGLRLDGAYTRAAQTETATGPFTTYQLAYTPTYKTTGTYHMHYKHWGMYISEMLTSGVYTLDKNEDYINGYLITDAGINYFISAKRFNLTTTLSGHNLTNVRYEVLEYYPQPLRHYSLTLLFQLKY